MTPKSGAVNGTITGINPVKSNSSQPHKLFRTIFSNQTTLVYLNTSTSLSVISSISSSSSSSTTTDLFSSLAIWNYCVISCLFNRIHAMAVYVRPLFGVLFLQGRFSLKNRSYCPLLRASTSPFKSTCLFIYLKEVPVALYGPHLHWYKPVRT
jgi:hypothetical protein